MPTEQLPQFSPDELQTVQKGDIQEVEMLPPTSNQRSGVIPYLVRISNNTYENKVSGDRFQVDIATPESVDHEAVRNGMLIGARVASNQDSDQSLLSVGTELAKDSTIASSRSLSNETHTAIDVRFKFLGNVKQAYTNTSSASLDQPCTIEFSIDASQAYGKDTPDSTMRAGERSGEQIIIPQLNTNYEFEESCIWINATLTALKIHSGTIGMNIWNKSDPTITAETEDDFLQTVTMASPVTKISKSVTTPTLFRLVVKVSGSGSYNLLGRYRRQGE